MRHLLAYLLLCAPCFGQAQDTIPPSPDMYRSFGPLLYQHAQDSADYATFLKDLRFTQGTSTADTVARTFRLRWIVSEHGGMSIISRGDSSIMQFEPNPFWGTTLGQPFQLADGRRGVQMVHETPCGLICRDTRFYIAD